MTPFSQEIQDYVKMSFLSKVVMYSLDLTKKAEYRTFVIQLKPPRYSFKPAILSKN